MYEDKNKPSDERITKGDQRSKGGDATRTGWVGQKHFFKRAKDSNVVTRYVCLIMLQVGTRTFPSSGSHERGLNRRGG